jgi:hypothetical protein
MVPGMLDAPGADGWITDSSLKVDSVANVDGPNNADIEGIYDDIA